MLAKDYLRHSVDFKKREREREKQPLAKKNENAC